MTNEDHTISRAEMERLAAERSASPVADLTIDGNVVQSVTRRTLLGRDPDAGDDSDGVKLTGDPMISKAHVAIQIEGSGLIAIDLNSSNGTSVRTGGVEVPLPTDRWTALQDGAVLVLGDTQVGVSLRNPVNTPASVPHDASTWAEPASVAPVVISAIPGADSAPPLPIVPIVPQSAASPGDWGNGVPPQPSTPSAPSSSSPSPCSQCGRPVEPGARFCDGCGAAMAIPVATAGLSWLPGDDPAVDDGSPADSESDGAASKRRWVLVGAAVAVVLIVGAGAFTLLGGGDDGGGSSTAAPAIPTQVEEQWSADVDLPMAALSDNSSVYVTSMDDGDAELVALSTGSGDERWASEVGSSATDIYLYGVVDSVVVVDVCDYDTDDGSDGGCTLTGISSSDGEQLWDQDNDDGYAWTDGAHLYRQDGDTLELLDPQTGDRIERVSGDELDVDRHGYVYVNDSSEVEVFSLSDLGSVFGPVDIDEDATDWTYDGRYLYVAVDDEISVVGADGETQFDTQVGSDSIYSVNAVAGGVVVVETDGEVLGVRPADGRADEIWSSSGSFGGTDVIEGGKEVALVYDEDDLVYLDASTGEEVLTVRDGYIDNWDHGSNGVLTYAYSDDHYEGTAYRFSDGEEMWSEDFDGSLALIDGAVLSLSDDEVTLYR